MKAIVFSGTRGDPALVCSCNTREKPKPSPDQVLVRVLYSPVHPSNLASVSPGGYPGPAQGGTPGSEGVGVVEEHGEGCSGAPPKGSRVLVLGVGTWCEFVVLPAKGLIVVPEGVSNQNAAQFFVNPMSAYLMTTQFLTPQSGEYLLQTAAGSALGRVVIQMGKIFGFKTINVIRNADAKAELIAAGADEVIVTATEKVSDRLKAITGGKGVKYAIDCVGGDGTTEIIHNMAFRGKLLIFGELASEEIHFRSGLMVVKLLTIQGFWVSDWVQSAPTEEKQKCFGGLMQLFLTGKLDCSVGKEFELKDFTEAFRASKDTKVGGSGKVMFKCS